MIKAVFFDLFFTLADPHGELEKNEYLPLSVSEEIWGKTVWEKEFTDARGRGEYGCCEEILSQICLRLPVKLTVQQKRKLHDALSFRMRKALCELPPEILPVLRKLKSSGYRMGIISNADAYDILHWQESPLREVFDTAVFSCEAGFLKPEPRIFEIAMEQMQVLPEESVFVGDGGSDELFGAKRLGMTTVLAEHLLRRDDMERNRISAWADFRLERFSDLPGILSQSILSHAFHMPGSAFLCLS